MGEIITRKCTKCSEIKSVDFYSKDKNVKKDGCRSVCKECEKKYHADYHKEHREEVNRKTRQYFLDNIDKERNRSYKYIYGITLQDYQAMYESQSGKCAVCGESKERLHVDHDHKTKKVRGLLCNGCNAGLGQLKENIGIIENLKSYVLKHI